VYFLSVVLERLFFPGINTEGRQTEIKKRRQNPKFREIDQFSGDAYSEFVEKYYGKSGHSDVEVIGGGKIHHIPKKTTPSSRGK